jgi:phosphohistidine phosphatase
MLLTLLRHAKAEPGRSDQEDWHRALEPKGRRDAEEIARRLKGRELVPDFIVTSPAVRAMETARIFARVFAISNLVADERLYLASPKVMLEVAQERGGTAAHLMIVGHNPGITEFADKLSAERSLDNMPTCSAYTLEFDIPDWKQIDWRNGMDADFEYPGRAT